MRALDRDGLTAAPPATLPAPAADGFDVAQAGRLMLDAAGVALAVADPQDRTVRLANRRLRAWFELDGKPLPALDALLPGLDPAALAADVAEGREHAFETETRVGRRRLALAARIAGESGADGRPVLVAELRDVSKRRALEHMLKSYAAMIEKQNRDLTAAKDRVERLLLNIMPKTVYEEWRRFGVTAPRLYPEATILMLDFAGFTEMAVTADPPALIGELNDVFTGFDRIVEQFGCERLKTIGDAYMAVAGLPVETSDHAVAAAGVAVRMRRFLERRNETAAHVWRARMGLHSGPVVGSIVGVQKYVYDVFGPGVNVAARLEAAAEPMEILLSDATRRRLDASFRLAPLGLRELRGAGRVGVWRLEGCDGLDD